MMVELGQLLNYINQLLKEIIVEYGDGVSGRLSFPQRKMFALSVEQVKN